MIDNTFFKVDAHVFQRQFYISIGTNCDLLTDLFLYSYEADFIIIQGLLKKMKRPRYQI